MKHAVRTFVLILGSLALMATSAAAQATVHGDLLKDWTALKDQMSKEAAAMPDDKFGFKPTPAQRSFAEHVLHIAQINVMLTQAIGGKTPAPQIDMKATSKAATIKAMNDSFDYAIAVIKEFDNKTIQDTVNAPFMGPSTRARLMFFLLGHTWDTYGQMAVYLRLNGVVPPASRQP
jgi:uncharacterized damage-inducible protein DinB